MNKYSVGVVSQVWVSYYYNVQKPDGSFDTSWNHNYQGFEGPVAQRYLDEATSKRNSLKPWTNQWQWLGYSLIDKLIETKPNNYPAVDNFPLVVSKEPSMKNREFRKRQREGEILVSGFKKHSVSVKYTRGTVIVDGGRVLGLYTGNNPLVKDGDVFYQNNKVIRIVGVPSLQYEYTLVEALTDLHPFDLGWVRSGRFVPDLEVNNKVVTSTLADAESGTLDLLTELAELPETVSFLADTIKKGTRRAEDYQRKIQYYTKLLKDATGKFAERISKKLASAWLAFRYAVMPIFYSIEDIKKTLKAYKRVFASFRDKASSDCKYHNAGFNQSSFASIVDRCWIKRSYSPEDLVDQLLGVLKVNPLSTAWELVTLSFVVDWFLNVGDVITAFSGNKAYIGQGSTFSRKIEGVSRFQSKTIPSVMVDIEYHCYDRIVIEPRDFIGLSFDFDMNWKRWLDAIALSLQPTIKTLKRLQRNA